LPQITIFTPIALPTPQITTISPTNNHHTISNQEQEERWGSCAVNGKLFSFFHLKTTPTNAKRALLWAFGGKRFV